MRKIILLFQIIIILLPAALFAQNRVITGTVKDINGVLPGAIVSEKGLPSNGTTTNGNGKFKLTLKGATNTLVVRFVGYSPQEVKLGTKSTVEVILQPNDNGLDEVTIVGFTPNKRITNTGAVSTINADEIRTVPTANVQNTLAGRLPGFTSVQSSGQPGKDASDFFIRGQSSLNASNEPLILVDDIEYTYDQLQQINVNEIESISILKDASTTAIYGIKGANGVLIVTTRRGKAGKPKFNFRVEGGLQSPTITPIFLNAYQSAELVNQAERNDVVGETDPTTGLPVAPSLTFTPKDLQLFANGTDPYGHPNTDWYNDVFRKYTYQANTNLDISGGDDQVKYFISLGAFNQNGNVKNFDDPQDLVNTNYYFTRYDFRSNLDLKANKTLSLRLDVTTRFGDINSPGLSSPISTIYNFQSETPFSAPFLNPNGSFPYNNVPENPTLVTTHLPTLNALLANGGYTHSRRTDYNVLVGAIQDLSSITDGLSATARIAYASSEDVIKGTDFLLGFAPATSFPSYYYNPANTTYTLRPGAPYVYPNYRYYGSTDLYTNTVNIQLFSNYDRTFGDNHFVGLLLLNQSSDASMSTPPVNYRGISAKIGYDYKQKFLFDFNTAYNGSDEFAAGHQYGIFPALGLGYVLSKETFFKDLFPTFNLFKLRGSIGVVGSDLPPGGSYVFQQTYNQSTTSAISFGQTAANTLGGITEGAQANPYVQWERDRKEDLGVDANLLNNHLTITADLFHDYRYDEFVIPQAEPAQLGVGAPYINVGKVANSGYDGQITYHNSIGAVQYNLGFVFSYAKNKILYESEAQPAYPWLAVTGHPIGQPFGYHFLNYYTPAEIAQIYAYVKKNGNNTGDMENGVSLAVPTYANSPATVDLLKAGDLRYQDLNGDGVISPFDERAIGYPTIPNTTLGLTLGVAYKGFSASILFQGSFGYSYIITGNGIEPFESQFQPIDLKAWTPQTAATAQFPEITTNFSQTVNSPGNYPSDYWYINAYYVRLKSLDIGYQLPVKLLPFHVNNLRIYFSAYNLFTWDDFKKYQQDPEASATNTVGDQYIDERVVNLGIQMGF
jgi:TonB-linked SusC/RagA family outer membrane protein